MEEKTRQRDTDRDALFKCAEVEVESVASFGRWVEVWREYRGLSLSEMARRSGWDAQFQNLLEKETRRKKNGDPPMPREETVKVIANVLNVPERDALLAAGYAPPDLRRSSYINAPRRSPEGNFVLLCQAHDHATQVENHAAISSENALPPDMTDVVQRLEQKMEEVWGRLAEYDRRFAQIQSEQSANHIVSLQHNPASKATPD